MKKFPSLKSNKDFQKVYKKGKSYGNKHIVMYILENNEDFNRVGISISKKVGNSIIRHKKTRQIREIFRKNDYKILKGFDIITVIRISAKDISYEELNNSYLHLIKLHKLFIEL